MLLGGGRVRAIRLGEILFELLLLHCANDLPLVGIIHIKLSLWLLVIFSIMLWLIRRLCLVLVITTVSLVGCNNWSLSQEIVHDIRVHIHQVVPSYICTRRARVVLHVSGHRRTNHITVTIYSRLSFVFIGSFSTFIFIIWWYGNDQVLEKLILGDCKIWRMLIIDHNLLCRLRTSSRSLTTLLLNHLRSMVFLCVIRIVRAILLLSVTILLSHIQVLMWLQLCLIEKLGATIRSIYTVWDRSASQGRLGPVCCCNPLQSLDLRWEVLIILWHFILR